MSLSERIRLEVPWRWGIMLLGIIEMLGLGSPTRAQQPPEDAVPAAAIVADEPASRRFALIVIGLPGDPAHEQLFRETSETWRQWLIDRAGVAPEHITLMSGREESTSTRPALAEEIESVAQELTETLRPTDSLWVFLLGHGSVDKRYGWFHLPGADLHDTDWADHFAEVAAREQVFWLTHSGSGRFVRSMSRPGRIVIAATDANGEVNETRFPHTLAKVMRRDGEKAEDSPPPPDHPGQDVKDQPTSASEHAQMTVLDLFRQTTEEVVKSYEVETIVLTEHAQMDDNGDGSGSELGDLVGDTGDDPIASDPEQVTASIDVPLDGRLAARTLIDQPVPRNPDDEESGSITVPPDADASASERIENADDDSGARPADRSSPLD